MQLGTDRDLHRAMSKHLRAGVLPAQFEMDTLRINDLRRHSALFVTGRATVSVNAKKLTFGSIFDKLIHALERLRDVLHRGFAVRRVGM